MEESENAVAKNRKYIVIFFESFKVSNSYDGSLLNVRWTDGLCLRRFISSGLRSDKPKCLVLRLADSDGVS